MATISVIGIGSGGINTLDVLLKNKINGILYTAIDTDVESLEYSLATEKLLLGEGIVGEHGTEGNPELGQEAALARIADLRLLIEACDIVILLACAGGGTGSVVINILSDIAHHLGKLTIVLTSRPFIFEGSKRNDRASECFSDLFTKTDLLVILPLDDMAVDIPKDTLMLDVFRRVDSIIAKAAEYLIGILQDTGTLPLNIDEVYFDRGYYFYNVSIWDEDRYQRAYYIYLDLPDQYLIQ